MTQIAGIDSGKGDLARLAGELLANAKSKMALGDFRGALDLLNRAIALDPANPLSWIKRAEAYNQLKQYSLARADALEAIKSDSAKPPAAWEQLATPNTSWAIWKTR